MLGLDLVLQVSDRSVGFGMTGCQKDFLRKLWHSHIKNDPRELLEVGKEEHLYLCFQ